VAAIPLLWIIPLVVYLFSFVAVFNGGGLRGGRMIILGLLAVTLLSLAYALYYSIQMPLIFTIAFYSAALFIACLFCHGELFRLRPAPGHATSFYLFIAAGGALGAFCVGVLAPLVLNANYEFVCALVFTSAMALVATWRLGWAWRAGCAAATALMVFVVVSQVQDHQKNTIVLVRSFYGALRVTETRNPADGDINRTLYHGTIEHGDQYLSDDWRKVPTTYYAEDSGVGLALNFCCAGRPRRVGIIGLGAGTVAAYGRAGDVFRFYEINPLVERIAHTFFTYLRESEARIEIVPGDARLSLAQEPPQQYDVIVVDAFSGDAIPVHLVTTQAIALYQRHLRPGGILAFHVSNQFLDLVPVVKQQADHAGLSAVWIATADNEDTGEYGADWVLITSNKDFLAQREVVAGQEKITSKPGLRLWTDDYSSLLRILLPKKWNLKPSKE
jgi:spermidine synthase